MKGISIVLFYILLSFPVFGQQTPKETHSETTTYYLIRHAEKDRSDKTNNNPNLTEKGLERAQRWSEVLKHLSFDMVYSTDYNRTKETAQPTAFKNNLAVTIYNPKTIDNKVFIEETKGKTVLIVGHSHSTPTFVNALIGKQKYPMIEDDNNSHLYIVTISGNSKTDQLLVIN